MPQINVAYWNIEDLGLNASQYRSSYPLRGRIIASMCYLAEVDVLLVQELRSAGAAAALGAILTQLNKLPAPYNNWRVDYIKGALDAHAAPPYATFGDLDWTPGRREGYAVFWNQNLAKFKACTAAPVGPDDALTANTQSFGVVAEEAQDFGHGPVVTYENNPDGGIVVPAHTDFVIPAGTVEPGHGPLANDITVAPGTVIPNGTIIGAAGVSIEYAAHQSRVVIPGGYTLDADFTLPAVDDLLEPKQCLSLVLDGRDTGDSTWNGNVAATDFDPAGGNNWTYLNFTRGGAYPASRVNTRRPAWLTIEVPGAGGPADALIPLIFYHAPLGAPQGPSGMQRTAYARPMYQVFDPAGGNWINANRAVCGGDFNVRLDDVNYAYDAFYDAFNAGGANCEARVYAGPVGGNRYSNVLNKTCVQLRDNPLGGGGPIYSANADDFRKAAIDNIFFRGFTALEAPSVTAGAVVNNILNQFVPLLNGGSAQVQNALEAYLDLPFFKAYWDNAWGFAHGPLPITLFMVAPQDTVWDLSIGEFVTGDKTAQSTNARRAAEFIHLCISDHQPVLFRMNL